MAGGSDFQRLLRFPNGCLLFSLLFICEFQTELNWGAGLTTSLEMMQGELCHVL